LRDRQVYVGPGHNNGRNLPRFWSLGHFREKFVSAKPGQMDVEDNQIREAFVHRTESGPPVDDVYRLETRHPQHPAIEVRQGDVIFDEKNEPAPSHDHAALTSTSVPS